MDSLSQLDDVFRNTGQKLTAESFTASFMSSTMSDLTAPSEMDFYRRASYLEEYGMQRVRELEMADRRRREQGPCKSIVTACQCIPQQMQSSTSTAAYGDMRLQMSPLSQGLSRGRTNSVKKKRTRWPSPKKLLSHLICGSDPMTSSTVGEDMPLKHDFPSSNQSRPSELHVAPADLEKLLKPAGSLLSKYDELEQPSSSNTCSPMRSKEHPVEEQHGFRDGIPEPDVLCPLRRYVSRSEPIRTSENVATAESDRRRRMSTTRESGADRIPSVIRAPPHDTTTSYHSAASNTDIFLVTSV